MINYKQNRQNYNEQFTNHDANCGCSLGILKYSFLGRFPFSLILIRGHERGITSDECFHSSVYLFDHELLSVLELMETVFDAELFIVLEGGLLEVLGHA